MYCDVGLGHRGNEEVEHSNDHHNLKAKDDQDLHKSNSRFQYIVGFKISQNDFERRDEGMPQAREVFVFVPEHLSSTHVILREGSGVYFISLVKGSHRESKADACGYDIKQPITHLMNHGKGTIEEGATSVIEYTAHTPL